MQNILTLNPIFPLKINLKVKKKTIVFVLFWVLSFFVILYFFQLIKIMEKNYQIKTFHQKIEKLTNQNIGLRERIESKFSLFEVEKTFKDLNFVKVDKIKYIPISDQYLVKKGE